MNEKENDISDPKIKTSKLAIISFLFAVLGVFVFPFHVVISRPQLIGIFGYKYYGIPEIVAFIIGISALIKIRKSKDMLKGKTLAIFTIILAGLLSFSWWKVISSPRSRAFRMQCGSNLMKIGKAMLIYANDYNKFPTPNKWCDLLLEPTGTADIENFICPKISIYKPFNFSWPFPKKGRCYYAINPKCNSNSSPDTVLLFETEVGWNKFGGPELLTTQNHGGQGCNILFSDSHVNFVNTGGLGDLKWSDEENND